MGSGRSGKLPVAVGLISVGIRPPGSCVVLLFGIEGVTGSKRVKTTRPDPTSRPVPDLVASDLHRDRAEQALGHRSDVCADVGGRRVCLLLIDVYSRMIVGWRCASHMRTEMVLDAIEMARWARGSHHEDLRCHSDAGSQFTSIRYGERLAEIGATPSIGTVGDSYYNALAETVNGYYKTELVRGPARSRPLGKPSRTSSSRPSGWVHWHNTQRLHGYLGDVPPAEFERRSMLAKPRASAGGNQIARVSIRPRALHTILPAPYRSINA